VGIPTSVSLFSTRGSTARLNPESVATVYATRAERKLVVLCSDTVLDVVPIDRRVLLESMMLKEFRHYCCDGHARVPWASAEDGEILLNVEWKGF
jgi:hypothetical protein